MNNAGAVELPEGIYTYENFELPAPGGVPQDPTPDRTVLEQLETLRRDGIEFRSGMHKDEMPAGAPSEGHEGTQARIAEACISNICEGARYEVEDLARGVKGIMDGEEIASSNADLILWLHTTAGTLAAIHESERMPLADSPEEFMNHVRTWHFPIMGRQREMNPGQWKTHDVGIMSRSGFIPLGAKEQVESTFRAGYPIIMDIEDVWLRSVMTEFLTVAIHPFHDGNGRSSRVAGNQVLVRHGYGRRVIRAGKHGEYCQGLNQIRAGNATPWLETVWAEHSRCHRVVAEGGFAGDEAAKAAGYGYPRL